MSLLKRLGFIEEKIRLTKKIALKDIASEFKISTRQARRDIEYFKDIIGAPIIYDKKLKGYTYKNFDSKNFFYINEKNLLFYTFVKKIAENINYFQLDDINLIKILENNLPEKYVKLIDKIIYETPEYEKISEEIISLIIKAIINKKLVEIHYQNIEEDISQRKIGILSLFNYFGKWYLIAYDFKTDKIKSFHLCDIINISLLDEEIIYKVNKEELNKFLYKNFGYFNGGESELEEVEINFYGKAANIISKEILDKNQKLITKKNKDNEKFITLKLNTNNYRKILTKVLSFGHEAEIIKPKDLKKQWLKEIEKMYKKYIV